MARTATGTLGSLLDQENTFLARTLEIIREDGTRNLLTDHDADITLTSQNIAATGTLTQSQEPGGEALPAAGKFSITSGNNAADGETVSIDGKTYTFQTTLTDVDGNVLIGADRTETLENLAAAINLGSGAGTLYAASTTLHPTVTAKPPTATPEFVGSATRVSGLPVVSNFTDEDFAFDGNIDNTRAKALSAYKPAPEGAAYIGLDMSGSPKRVVKVSLWCSRWPFFQSFYIFGLFGGNTRAYSNTNNKKLRNFSIELRAANGSLPADPTTGGTVLNDTMASFDFRYSHPTNYPRPDFVAAYPFGQLKVYGYTSAESDERLQYAETTDQGFVNVNGGYRGQNVAQGHKAGRLYEIVLLSDDMDTTWDYVWVVLRDNTNHGQSVSGDVYLMAEMEVFEPASGSTFVIGPGDMGVTAKTAGDEGNDIATVDTVTNGDWDNPTLTGGQDSHKPVLDGETVTIDGKTYTFQDTLTDVDGNVQVGGDALESLANLVAAINLDAGAGTKYATSTTVHPTVSAGDNLDGSISLTAKTAGDAGNSIATTETLTDGSFADSTLTGGVTFTYTASPGLSASAVLSANDLGIQGLDVRFPAVDGAITEDDLNSGRLDGAQCALRLVDWSNPSAGLMLLFTGEVGDVEHGDTGDEVVMEIRGLLSKGRQVRVEKYSPSCRADLGDDRCKFPIDQMRVEFTVSEVVDSSTFKATAFTQEDDHWKLGLVHFLTGNNAEVAIEVLSNDQSDNSVTLFLPTPFPLQVGDTGEIWPGCDKTIQTCLDRFDNVVNFRGEPFQPDEETLFAYRLNNATSQQPLSTGSVVPPEPVRFREPQSVSVVCVGNCD